MGRFMRRPFQAVIVRTSTAQRELSHVPVATDCRTVALPAHAGTFAQARGLEEEPALLIVDAGDDPEGAIAQIRLFKERCPSARIAVLADEYHRNHLVSAYEAGANGCFVKVMSCGGFIRAIEMIMLGETVLPPDLLPFIAETQDHHTPLPTASNGVMPSDPSAQSGVDGVPRLSAREKCILRCVV